MERIDNPLNQDMIQDQNEELLPIVAVFLLDESGSMYSLWETILTGLQETIESLDNDLYRVSVIRYCTQINDVTDLVNPKELPTINPNMRGGTTALYDAIAKAYEIIGTQNYEQAIITAFTDGLENNSKAYYSHINKLIAEHPNVILSYEGCEMDRRLNVDRSNSKEFTATNAGIKKLSKERTRAFSKLSATYMSGSITRSNFYE